ncbi:MAG: DUF3568 family protein [Planctomycetota bacterium]
MKTFALPALLCLGLLSLGSCVLVAGAAIGAGAMYALGEDSTEVFVDAPMEDAYAAAQAELQEKGELDEIAGGLGESSVVGKVDGHKVEVYLTRITDNATRVVVQARKWADLAPNLELAQRLADRIAYRVTR